MTAEHDRLSSGEAEWRLWGPYLSERSWGTVREDYSPNGDAWRYFPHDHARSRVYRWNEDGLAGICDDQQRLCFALAFWNGKDPILKERLFGLAGPEGNHGEDVKEYYFYLDSTPTHSYMKMLYKYPQAAFPYTDLVQTNARRGKSEPEYELIDTGIFAEHRYFDIFVEYAKAGPKDMLVRVAAFNRGPDRAELHILPTLWFRNTWNWAESHLSGENRRPELRLGGASAGTGGASIVADHPGLGRYVLALDGTPELLFTENETNAARLFGVPNASPYVKDGINEAIVYGRSGAVNPDGEGTKAAAHFLLAIDAGSSASIRLRLASAREGELADPFTDFDLLLATRQAEADEFYASIQPADLGEDARRIQRQAFAGMLWSKQFYHYDVERWLRGDPGQPIPPAQRLAGRNRSWVHFNTTKVLSMPDKWEYPWFASWDLAFHCIPLAMVDPDFAKEQLITLGREWYQHPNGQVPAYEWDFGDVNPPVLAWAAWRVYQIERGLRGEGDRFFLERIFHKLLLNFNWWVNRKDREGMNVFEGGFLGLDNIGVFDRSAMLPTGGHIEQSDGTSWMAMFSLNMLAISLELASKEPVYEDIAIKFFEHFLYIARAMNNILGEGIGLWDEEDEFFYDVLHIEPSGSMRLKVRSMVGLIPLFAVTVLEPEQVERLPEFEAKMEWFLDHRPELANLVSRWQVMGMHERRLLAILRGHRMKRVLHRMLEEQRFLSPFGVRSLSRYHREHPYVLETDGMRHIVKYLPGESDSGLFGGNSNWRGPVWFPVNFLIVESLREFHRYYGDDFKVECPTGSGQYRTLAAIADELSGRLMRIFLRDAAGRRPVLGNASLFQTDPNWRDYIPFHEYFHGDDGRGLGASHQTGWTGLVATLIQRQGDAPPGHPGKQDAHYASSGPQP